MKRTLRITNFLAILGTAWMGFVIVIMRISPEFVMSVISRQQTLTVLALTELVFTFSLLLFFAVLHLYNSPSGQSIVPFRATTAALISASWMSLVAVLHRFPNVWRWVATQEAGLIVSITQVIFTIPLLFFFILFTVASGRLKITPRLRVASVVATTGYAWLLLVSAMRISPAVWVWLMEKGAGKFVIITEPFVAISLLVFLTVFLFELDVMTAI